MNQEQIERIEQGKINFKITKDNMIHAFNSMHKILNDINENDINPEAHVKWYISIENAFHSYIDLHNKNIQALTSTGFDELDVRFQLAKYKFVHSLLEMIDILNISDTDSINMDNYNVWCQFTKKTEESYSNIKDLYLDKSYQK